MTSLEEVKPHYPKAVGRIVSNGNAIWRKPRIDVTTNRTGIVSDPDYYNSLHTLDLDRDATFWWKGRVTECMDTTTRIYSAKELAKQEAKLKRKQRKEQLSCQQK